MTRSLLPFIIVECLSLLPKIIFASVEDKAGASYTTNELDASTSASHPSSSYTANDATSQDTFDDILDLFDPTQYTDFLNLDFYNNDQEEGIGTNTDAEPMIVPFSQDQYIPHQTAPMSPTNTEDWKNLLDLSDSPTELSDTDATNRDSTERGIETGTRHQRRLSRYGFPSGKWQISLLSEQVRQMYDRLASTWPDNLPIEMKARRAIYANVFLNKHPEVVQGLVANDEEVWKTFLERMKITPTKLQSALRSAHRKVDRKDHLVNLNWLDQPILYSEKEAIQDRLSIHWNGVPRRRVNARLDSYTSTFGAITSPEVLLRGNEEDFIAAANAIDCEGENKFKRHAGASKYDILHQGSASNDHISLLEAEGTSYVPRKSKHLRFDVPRFKSGQSWMKNKTPGEIESVHAAIRAHLVDKISRGTLQKFYLQVNEYLESNRGLLERIEAGERYAAWYVAGHCVKRSGQMRNVDKCPC